MKERPIIFSDPMVRAILESRKTQSRRVVKTRIEKRDGLHYMAGQRIEGNPHVVGQCKYGRPGDRLWVREAFVLMGTGAVFYRADGDELLPDYSWHPSVHMPRWASRILLEITGVRVERLRDISEEDAKAEGVEPSATVEMRDGSPCYTLPFRMLWESIHGTDAWERDDWVWVVEFKRIVPKVDQKGAAA